MPSLTSISWKKFEKFLIFIGCDFKRQKGDHRIYWRDGLKRPIVIPCEKNLAIFIIRNNLRTLSISHDKYLDILKRI